MIKKLLVIFIFSFLLASPTHALTYSKRLCKKEGFSCLRVKGRQSWSSLWPDEQDRSIMMRVNRMNVGLYAGLTLALPENLHTANIMDFSPFPLEIKSINEKLVVVDPIQLAWGAYDESGTLVRWGPAISGMDWCDDMDQSCRTKPGRFRIYSIGSSNCISSKFPLPDGGAPMPYCMYFNGGQALHGSPNGVAGHNASHGCVRMYVNDAEWLRYDFIEGPTADNNYRGTQVIVKPYEEELETEEGEEI